MRSLKSECLNRMIFFGEASLRRALREFGEHFHHERNPQGLANRIIDAGDEVGRKDGELIRLGRRSSQHRCAGATTSHREPVSKSWFLNGNRLRFRCSHAHEPFYPKDPLPDRIFLPYGLLVELAQAYNAEELATAAGGVLGASDQEILENYRERVLRQGTNAEANEPEEPGDA